jgi:DNA-binding MarR family transcriptional regulator
MLEAMSSGKPAEALAREVWRMMFDLLIRSAPARTRSLARRGLTPNDSRALFSLDARTGRSMRSLAEAWECDPSYATWIVNRLESLDLAKRQVVSHDRRIKLVILTRKGQNTRTDLLREFHEPPPEFDRLGPAELEALRTILTRLAPAGATSPAPPRRS